MIICKPKSYVQLLRISSKSSSTKIVKNEMSTCRKKVISFLKKVVTMFTIDDLRPHENDVLRIKGLDFRLYIEEDEEGVSHAVWRNWKVPLQVSATPNSHEGMLLVAELSWAETQDLMGTAVYRGDQDDLNTY